MSDEETADERETLHLLAALEGRKIIIADGTIEYPTIGPCHRCRVLTRFGCRDCHRRLCPGRSCSDIYYWKCYGGCRQ